MSAREIQKEMLKQVALALDELRGTVTFVGGCTTALLITDEYTVEQVRHTEDVDLIVSVMGYIEYNRLKAQLQSKGFKETPLTEEDWPICAMKIGDLRVDIMPDDEAILGFSNRWYKTKRATQSAFTHSIIKSSALSTTCFFKLLIRPNSRTTPKYRWLLARAPRRQHSPRKL